MTDPGASQLSDVSGAGPLDHPTNRVLAAVNPQQLSALVPALIDAGYAPIGILAGEAGQRRLQQTAGASSIGGLLRRIQMSVGGDLDYAAQAQEALDQGRASLMWKSKGMRPRTVPAIGFSSMVASASSTSVRGQSRR